MILKELNPKQALNKAFLRLKPTRIEIDNFKKNLAILLDRTNDAETEEFHKNLLADFLKDTYYKQNHFINTKGRNDLVIHNGQTANATVGVIIEAKKPSNKTEMLARDNINKKAFQELVLYYLRERIAHKNLEIKYLIATNIYEWFIFDAILFDRLFAQNKPFVNQFTDFEEGRLADTKTDFFYKHIAEPFINSISSEIEFTYFNFNEYYHADIYNPQFKSWAKDDNSLIALFKLLSPEHLLKLPFANDSNTLDKDFYNELLYIIGLTEVKDAGKKLIQRNQPSQRLAGTVLEDTITQLDSLDKLSRLDKPEHFGNTKEERLFSVALELSITWINRILFLKLLEAQLLAYHQSDKSDSFLRIDKIKTYNELNSLFFQVLAKKYDERNENIKKDFEKVPYLNSSLFEPTDLEHATIFISNLNDGSVIPISSQTVLKDRQGNKRTGKLNTLQYLFEFLDAYDFGAEGKQEIQEDNKTLINASVLGLIFEKINGYKDGSFFTPGFITMYMCRETIRKAVIQKFNQLKGWNCNSLEELYDKIEDRKEANQIVNSLKICDPAVGSGHFLVSALNEIIAIKNDLKILQDRNGKRLKEYHVEIVNDELVVIDEDGEAFEYNPTRKESQRIQETLFHEKQTIIENCLFGVDINPNSVKICRLRLWIELLKNAYYKTDSIAHDLNYGLWNRELETLPNIDINIKCGNSLVSRFPIDANLANGLNNGSKSKWNIDTYKVAVSTYRNAQNREQKREMERLIAEIKADFRTKIAKNDPKLVRKRKLEGELFNLMYQTTAFETQADKQEKFQKVAELQKEIDKISAEIEEIENNKIFENAFEWRFEFPEVLNDEGDFVGFDVVMGNPPYIQLQAMKGISEQLKRFDYKTYEKTGDIYSLFYEKGYQILKDGGLLAYITSNKWMRANYGKSTRNYFLEYTQPLLLVDLGSGVFKEATVDANILIFKKQPFQKPFEALDVSRQKNTENLYAFKNKTLYIYPPKDESWIIASPLEQTIKQKIERIGKPLKEWDINIYRGILTGYNEAFIIDGKKKNELIAQDPKSAEIIKPILRGKDIKRYKAQFADLWLINTHNGIKNKGIPRIEVEKDYPAIYHHLKQYESQLIKRQDQGDHWTNLRDCAYIREFEKEKIVFTKASKIQSFTYDDKGDFVLNTSYILVGKKIKYLLALLNSKLFQFAFKRFYQSGGIDGEMTVQSVEQIPIVYPNARQEKNINKFVEQILAKKRVGQDTTALEAQIDRMVYELYGLTEKEIKIVEQNGSIY